MVLYLTLPDGQKIMPISIKEVDLEPEYQFLFGHRFNLFKRAYVVKFAAVDLTGNYYLQNNDSFNLVFSSSYKESFVKWGK